MPPRRATKAATTSEPATTTSRPARSARARKPVVLSPEPSDEDDDAKPDAVDDDGEDSDDVAPARKASRAKAASASTSRRGARKVPVTPPPELDEDAGVEEEDEEEDVKPARRNRGTAATRAKRVVVAEEDDDDEATVHAASDGENANTADSYKTAPKGRSSSVNTYHTLPTPPPSNGSRSPVTHVAASPSSVASGSRTPMPDSKQATREQSANGGAASEDDDEADDRTVRAPSATPSIPDDLIPRTPSKAGSQPVVAPPTPAPALPLKPAGPKPRLTIHKLVLVNFKSYAGRQEIGPFHKSFSAIVGPNGSGKSNTIDALLFVFGYRASKMRQGKLSELIHNSAGKEGLETCSVEVWFREIVDLPGVNEFLLVPNSQLVVTRTAYRNNSSKYTINDRTSSFTEVTTLLKGKGIDLDHNRFLILQGEVESIALMKAKAQNEHEDGLLEYLEDIIGTTKYKQPIEDASQEVEALNEQRGEKMNRLRVVEREKASLEDKKTEAEAYLRDTNDLTRKKSLLWQYHMYTLQNNLEITTKAISLNGQLVEEQERNAHHLAEITDLQKGYDEKHATFEEVKRLTDALVKDSKKFEKEEVGMQEKRKHLVTKQKKLKKSITDDGHARSEALSTVQNCEAELEANRAKVVDLERKLENEENELEEIRDSLKDKTDVFTSQIETKQRELEPWTAKISEKQSAIDVAQSERDLLAQKASGMQAALGDATEAVQKVKAGAQAKEEEHEALQKELAGAKTQLAQFEAKAEAKAQQGAELRDKVTRTRQKADEAKASLAADKSENAVLASLNKLKAQGRIKGFHGRLGDLGVIDDKYDVAVTTACGALNNLVVDTVEQGQACIEHLRKGNVGRASFMVLEKLPPRNLGPIETPENVPRLFDLIRPKDARFAPAFYKGVFDTLVAADLEQAQRIGYGKKRWRVVTLAGQLIDPSGTMSGGGTKVSRGGMSSKFAGDKVAPEVVARYEQESAAAEQALAAFLAGKRELDAEIARLKQRVPQIEMSLEKVELDVQTGAKRIAEAEKRLAEVRAQARPDAADEARIRALDAEVAALVRDVGKLREKSGAITEQIRALQNQILDVGGVKLRAIQSKVATTKGLLDMANDAITKAEVGQAKAERDADKLAKAVAGNTAKLDEVEAELAVVEGDLQACSADLALIRDKVQEAQDASADVQESLAEAKAELDEKSASINAFRALEMDIKQKVEDNMRIQKDSQDKHRHWKKRHEELELVYVDEEDEEEEGEGITAEQDGAATEGDEAAADKPTKRRKTDSLELVEYSADELQDVDKDMLNGEITQLEEEIAKAKPNLNVLAEYRKREAEFLERARDMEAVTTQRDCAKQRHDELRKVRLDEFMAGFSAISAKLKEMYQMITMGGNAEIELVDTMDPFSEGVVLSIMPPKKSWRPIANLSGGEKTLASLALVFALHVFKPTPLYFMDEIDAALDFKNVSIVANYIQSKTQAAQFIVISLRNDMFELAHRLVGIYKTSNCTKSVAIDNQDLRTQAVPRPPRPLGMPDGLRTPAPNQGPPRTPAHHGLAAVPRTPAGPIDSLRTPAAMDMLRTPVAMDRLRTPSMADLLRTPLDKMRAPAAAATLTLAP